MVITVLGSGAGLPSKNRNSSSYWVSSGGIDILLDCGEGCAKQIRSLGIDPRVIDAICITHMHSDHWSSFPLVVQMMHLFKRDRSLAVFAPSEGIKVLQSVLESAYLWDEKIGFEIKWNKWNNEEQIEIGIVKITPFLNRHLDENKINGFRHPFAKFECFSLLIEAESKTGLYTSDIAKLDDLTPLMQRELHWLLIEGMHFPISEFESFFREHKVGRIFVTHVPETREEEEFPGAQKVSDGQLIEI